MDLGKPEESKKEESKDGGNEESKKEEPASKLDPRVLELIKFIFDMKLIEKSVIQIGYDPKQLPLGSLSKETVQEGYKYLRLIEAVLEGKEKGDIAQLSSKFYTYIPHNFSMRHMSNFIIDSKEKLKAKLDLIANLMDINIAHTIINPESNEETKEKQNLYDENYQKLKCDMKALEKESDDFKMINEFLQNTSDGKRLTLLDAFDMKRQGEDKIFNPQNLDNK